MLVQVSQLLINKLATVLNLDQKSCSIEEIVSTAITQLQSASECCTKIRRCCSQPQHESNLHEDLKILQQKENGGTSDGLKLAQTDEEEGGGGGECEVIPDGEEDDEDSPTKWLEQFTVEEIEVSEEELVEFEKIAKDEPGYNPLGMEWIIAPLDEDNLQEQFLDNCCLILRRPSRRDYYKNLISSESLRNLLKSKSGQLEHAFDVDVVRVEKDGERVNFGGSEGDLVDVDTTLKLFDKEGCSIRILHPQRWGEEVWCTDLWTLLANIENQYGCRTGCNVYWTPGDGKQGFAPHYDDIDAFILQVEGSKYWKIYAPQENEILDRFSSQDYAGKDLGEPIFEGAINPGDLLYMPRGTIHQAYTCSDTPSLHLTVSLNQRCTYRDFLERHLAVLWDDSVALRRTLPSNRLFDYMRTQNCDNEGEEFRQALIQEVGAMVSNPLALNETVDSMIAEFQSIRLPLPLPPAAKQKRKVTNNTSIKTTYLNGARMLPIGDEQVAIVHCYKNSFFNHCDEQNKKSILLEENEAGWIRFPVQCAEIMEFLLGLEDWVRVCDIEITAADTCTSSEDQGGSGSNQQQQNGQGSKQEAVLPMPVIEIVQKLVDGGVLLAKE